jgi:cobalt/nickel transport system permease protein
MFDIEVTRRESPIRDLDPRLRLVFCLMVAVLLAACRTAAVCGAGLAIGIAVVIVARVPLRHLLRRLVMLNALVLVLAALLPFSVPGNALVEIGPLRYSDAGLFRVVVIALKANAILLLFTALVSTIDVAEAGRALAGLRVPARLVTLYVLTVRYIATLDREYQRLRRAMRARCFQPRSSLHTIRSLGQLVATLLVRAFDRGERLVAAMKCRGWSGVFPLSKGAPWRVGNYWFVATGLFLVLALGWMEWMTATL